MKRRDLLKTISTFLGVLFFGNRIVKIEEVPSTRPQKDEDIRTVITSDKDGNPRSIKGKIGQILFAGEWLKYDTLVTLVYTNQGWIQLTKVKGRFREFGLCNATISCYDHPELANTEMPRDLWEFIRNT